MIQVQNEQNDVEQNIEDQNLSHQSIVDDNYNPNISRHSVGNENYGPPASSPALRPVRGLPEHRSPQTPGHRLRTA